VYHKLYRSRLPVTSTPTNPYQKANWNLVISLQIPYDHFIFSTFIIKIQGQA
jgi:hypothetical protein